MLHEAGSRFCIQLRLRVLSMLALLFFFYHVLLHYKHLTIAITIMYRVPSVRINTHNNNNMRSFHTICNSSILKSENTLYMLVIIHKWQTCMWLFFRKIINHLIVPVCVIYIKLLQTCTIPPCIIIVSSVTQSKTDQHLIRTIKACAWWCLLCNVWIQNRQRIVTAGIHQMYQTLTRH